MLVGLIQPVNATQAPAMHADSTSHSIVQQPNTTEEKPLPTDTPEPQVTKQASTPVVVAPVPQDNETIVWNFLINNGFSREQTAGIMGNLQQEHNFNTSEVDGGLGIAQWIMGRATSLKQHDNYLDITVQLNFLLEELNSYEYAAMQNVKASTTVEGAVIAFSHLFERCGNCMDDTRIQYANNILGRH